MSKNSSTKMHFLTILSSQHSENLLTMAKLCLHLRETLKIGILVFISINSNLLSYSEGWLATEKSVLIV